MNISKQRCVGKEYTGRYSVTLYSIYNKIFSVWGKVARMEGGFKGRGK